ncbi:acyltransferase family protein [Corticimicrobacter populi]|uniref:Acyltransferase 3 domain-containing protein n=1 Tax=Corticimicrobacter populi TaxID=2175229 RepID=A0A2V1K221_9BURK|nr:acyltransferase [Corticimicrobacter populi]PWF22176.1 hypothetical protein DD235_12400 [Corticimicrobacter populi]
MKRIAGLDGIRALSIILVILSHVAVWPRIGLQNGPILNVLSPSNGVGIFFVLSGFLITLLLIEEKQKTGKTDIFAFFMRRTLRILPLYFIAITFVLLLDIAGKANVPNCIWPYAYTYTINFAPRACNHQSISHLWSLAVEEHFYLVWPLVFMLGRRIAIFAAAAFAAACIFYGFSPFEKYASTHRLVTWTFPAAAPIAFGCLAAFILNNSYVKRIFTDNSGAILLAIFAGTISPAFLAGKTLWMLSIASLLVYIYHNQNSVLVRFLELKPMIAIGIMSYGLYVWHGIFTGNGPWRQNAFPFPPEMDYGLWISLIVAPISYLAFEKPILRLKRFYKRT